MNYLRLPHMDNPVSVFDICQAHAQLESDYNVGGWVRERPSNQRRREATSCQLDRLGYHDAHRWVDVYTERDDDGDPADEDVKNVYIINVLKWDLPITDEERVFIAQRYVPEFLSTFENWRFPCLSSHRGSGRCLELHWSNWACGLNAGSVVSWTTRTSPCVGGFQS